MCGQHVENGEVADYGHLILDEPQYHDAVRLPAFKDANVRLGARLILTGEPPRRPQDGTWVLERRD